MNQVKDIYFIGRLNRDIFKVVTEDIQTDEVIITEERITHIKKNHPGDYEKYFQFAREIIENPDFILEANKPYTGLVLKNFSDNNTQFKTVLRIKTSHDEPEYKNSVITFMKIDEKEWDRLLKKKKVLYKRE